MMTYFEERYSPRNILLAAAGNEVVHNVTGANLRSGIATTLLQAGRRGDVGGSRLSGQSCRGSRRRQDWHGHCHTGRAAREFQVHVKITPGNIRAMKGRRSMPSWVNRS